MIKINVSISTKVINLELDKMVEDPEVIRLVLENLINTFDGFVDVELPGQIKKHYYISGGTVQMIK